MENKKMCKYASNGIVRVSNKEQLKILSKVVSSSTTQHATSNRDFQLGITKFDKKLWIKEEK